MGQGEIRSSYNGSMQDQEPGAGTQAPQAGTGAAEGASLSASAEGELSQWIARQIRAEGGWWPFDRFMAAALYTPGMGYYAHQGRKFGLMPQSGSDFVTAPELSPLFGRALAAQVAQALEATATSTVYEFGAGSGALALQLLQTLGDRIERYEIVDLSASLRERQSQQLQAHAERVHWHSTWPQTMQGVVVANELLDAMPVQLLHWDGQQWWERGVQAPDGAAGTFSWADRPTMLRPPVTEGFVPGTVVEVAPQAQAFMRTLAQHLKRGAAFFIDYGFPEREFYHPQRTGGTLMCHRLHQADMDPLSQVGLKDITAHVDFTAVALAAQEAGLTVLGYTSQARFLLNCGLLPLMEQADVAGRAHAAKLITEHEMGELFKVLGVATEPGFDAMGFTQGDRSHTL